MEHEIYSNNTGDLNPIPPVRMFWRAVQTFRFIPESYLAAVGAQWDPGLDQLVYLRMFVEEETGEAVR